MNLTNQIILAWHKAHKQANDNPKLLLLSDETFNELCGERMRVCGAADKILYSLRGNDLPDPLKRHLAAQSDKGCPRCWFSSMRKKLHADGTPSCEAKIKEWFDSQKALMAYAKMLEVETPEKIA